MDEKRRTTLLFSMVTFLLVWFLLWLGGLQLFGAIQTAHVASGMPPYEATLIRFLIQALSPPSMALVALIFATFGYYLARRNRTKALETQL
jgi:hypothetical protein